MDCRDNRNLPSHLTAWLSDQRVTHLDKYNSTQSCDMHKLDRTKGENMKLRHSACTLLACCSVLLVVVCCSPRDTVTPLPPPGCTLKLAFSTEVSSSSEGNGNIHRRSLAPWIWKSSTVKHRIPSTIWEAECSSSFCSSPNPGQTDRHNLNSVPIYQNILVLNPQDGGRCYTASYRSVAVGCTCVWAKTN